MAVEQKKILIRRGNKADLVLTDLQPGEQVLALDTNEVGIKTSGGDMIWYAHADDLAAHAARTDNPHSVSAAQIGAVLASEKGVVNGVPTLNADGKVVQDPANKGVANGVASLGSDGLIPPIQLQSSYSFNTILTNFGWDWTGKNSGVTWGAKIGKAMIFQGWFGVTDVGNGGAMIIHLGGSLPISEDAFVCELFDVGTGKTYTLCNKAANKEGQAIYPDLVPYTSDGAIADSTMFLNHTCFFGGTYVVHD